MIQVKLHKGVQQIIRFRDLQVGEAFTYMTNNLLLIKTGRNQSIVFEQSSGLWKERSSRDETRVVPVPATLTVEMEYVE